MKKIEFNYYDEFIKNADLALNISMIFKDFSNSFDINKANEIKEQVHQIENEADGNLHKITNYLVKDFLPPIDREDIIALSHRIDDVIDCIDEVVINLDILNIRFLREDFMEFSNLINQCCLDLKKMLQDFKNIKEYEKTQELIISINKNEEFGDGLYQQAIRNLYQSEKNPIEVSAWTIIYASLENCFDACENVADCVEEIILKNT